ncbi:glutamine--fructose-6-phosphate transaminase (isomerizing) [Candidatus Micrarchaeota archaeon]|nr:glutamine--fructose-6-phosphate transaminase (isomerizing) [Candidatus Micrarchaeota archaeon]
MCGIIGYVGSEQAVPILSEGLKKLEYRGYDSAGLATISNEISLQKNVGAVSDIISSLNVSPGKIGIAHTRWATHGGVTKQNAHPHASASIVVVHNGIIENYESLKKELVAGGCVFTSQTDSEVIPHLIEKYYVDNLEQAVIAASKKLEGSFAFLAISDKEKDKVVGVRKDSPLVVGLSSHGCFFASDVTPLIGKADRVVFMDDYEVAVAQGSDVKFYHYLDDRVVSKQSSEIALSSESTGLNGFDHYMLKEILEQPLSIKQACAQDFLKLEKIAGEVLNAKRVFFVACGTSFHSALVGKQLFSDSQKHSSVILGSEFDFSNELLNNESVVIAISQSGETADVLSAVKKAKEKGAKVYSIVNVVGSSLDRYSDLSLYLNCGPEICVASTKAFTSQLVVLYLLANALIGKAMRAKDDLMELSETLSGVLPYWGEKAEELSENISKQRDVYFIGKSTSYPVVLEGALKLKEISYIHAEGMHAGELKHGTMALISQGTPVVMVNPVDDSFIHTLNNGLETKARGAFLIGLSEVENSAYDFFVRVPKSVFPALMQTIPLQLIAYYSALKLGRNPDKPRNLAKSVTVK